MDLLKRNLAPILPSAFAAIDDEARRVLELHLAGRKIVDFVGPRGWTEAAVNTGRLRLVDGEPIQGVHMGVREVQPMIEVRIPLHLPIMELDQIGRGAVDPNLDPVVRAAERIALAEDRTIFYGLEAGRVTGILEASPHAPLELPEDLRELPRVILAGKEALRRAGVSGPYVLALGGALYDEVFAATDDGHPIAKSIEQLLVDRPIVRAEAIRGGAILSARGGDYELTVGQDVSIGYAHHTREDVELYVTESFTFRVLEPAAAVALSARGAEDPRGEAQRRTAS